MVGFHWHHEWVTPRLRMAVGDVSLEWAGLDIEITRMCEGCWSRAYPDERGVPRPFDKRQKGLRAFGQFLYASEPDENLIWAWFLERVKNANFKRDDIAHGIPGKVTNEKGEQYDGLMVPYPSRAPKFIKMSLSDIEALVESLKELRREMTQVSFAFHQALAASSPNTRTWLDPNMSIPLTMDNRSPKLPRWQPPPPTFRP